MSVTFQSAVPATPASGTVVASETIAGAELQRVKIALGASGADDGDVSILNGLPIRQISTLTVGGTVQVRGVDVMGDSAPIATEATLISIKNTDGIKKITDPVTVYNKTGDSTYQVPRLDAITHTLQTIDYSHHEIHSGSYFCAHHNAASKNDGTTINIYLKTPAGSKLVHMFMQWSASGQAYARILEAPTVTSNTGTNANTCMNHRRDSATASIVLDNATSPAAGKYAKDVTVTGNGTMIWEDFAGAAKNSAGTGRNDSEFVLAANTAYVFQVESDAAGLVLAMYLSWYEHTDKAA